ncbi:MAG: hypothetical protein UU93_C0019G0010 [Candidatus Amesbacteria bacterium GW2011_GWA2_42_12]|uniref:N-acetyltransferase domain-containing protein n=1 Tax=Candidatus Amesbacteria bacterium GW2011_GWA2_42_12 TaxID=1618356 RepID=A0A0G0Y3E7_9BACT|nr:MAG: hypothetical protein UU93_C0019G0010 [Candidatus Amesbacteria bacterium GW2011_GWA2_42_12]
MVKIPSFKENNRVLLGILYESINEHDTFTHVRSVFTDKWYNFIVPAVTPDKFDWALSTKVIENEQKNGFSLSYYVPQPLYSANKSYFTQLGKENESESDFYVFVKNEHRKKTQGKLVLIDVTTLQNFLEMVKVCFPEWENNETYSRYFYQLQNKNTDHLIKNYMYRIGNKDVGFCGYVGSQKQNVAYIHNTGVLPRYRRKGYFSNMIQLLANFSVENNIENSFALVDQDGASFMALQKLGFETKCKYYLFDL